MVNMDCTVDENVKVALLRLNLLVKGTKIINISIQVIEAGGQGMTNSTLFLSVTSPTSGIISPAMSLPWISLTFCSFSSVRPTM